MPDPARHVNDVWTHVQAAMRRLSNNVQVRPKDANEIFKRMSGSGGFCFEVRPTVFHLPERAANPKPDLYVVVSGEMAFEAPTTAGVWRMSGFKTRIAYFRAGPGQLDHTCGLHYDLDASPAHPIFHVQFDSLSGMKIDVEQAFRTRLAEGKDAMAGVIRNVRIPTAQMDFFSVVLQLCADHLVGSGSPKPVVSEFSKLRTYIAETMSGACAAHPGLVAGRAARCSRAPHWYLNPPPASSSGRAGPPS